MADKHNITKLKSFAVFFFGKHFCLYHLEKGENTHLCPKMAWPPAIMAKFLFLGHGKK